MTCRPGEAIGIVTGRDAAHDLQRMQVDHDHIPVGRTRDERASAVGLHQNSGSAMTHRNSFDGFVSRSADHSDIWAAQAGDESELSIGSEFQPVGAAYVSRQRLRYLL